MELRKFIVTTIREYLNENVGYKQYVVFHSSNEYFNKFDLSKITNMGGDLYGYGFYFTNNITYSKQFGKYTYKCEITLSKPLDLTIKSTKETLLNLIKIIDIPKDELHSLISLINNNSFTTAFRYIRKYISFEELSNIFDGVIGYADADGGGKEYVVYNPNNIKILSIEVLS